MNYLTGILKALFITGFDEDGRRHKAEIAISLCKILVPMMIIFGLFELEQGNYSSSILQWIMALFFAVYLFFMHKQQNLFTNFTVSVVFMIYFASFFTPLVETQTLFWFPLIPLISLFIMGKRRGVWWTLIFLVGNGLALAKCYIIDGGLPWSESHFLYVFLAFFVIFLMALKYEGFKSRLEDQLRTRAEFDYLTNTLNRYKFFSLLDQELERYRRYGTRLSILMFDIDHFKRLNDRYGHLVGDSVLKRLAGVVSDNIRKTDIFARYGGEEFVILALETDVHGAACMAEKLRKLIEATDFSDVGNGAITVSFGVTSVGDNDTTETLINRVDEGLYLAKKAGRNKIVVTVSSAKHAA